MRLPLSGFVFLLGYVLLVVLLSWLFLGESMGWMKLAGALLTVAGVALLSWQQK